MMYALFHQISGQYTQESDLFINYVCRESWKPSKPDHTATRKTGVWVFVVVECPEKDLLMTRLIFANMRYLKINRIVFRVAEYFGRGWVYLNNRFYREIAKEDL